MWLKLHTCIFSDKIITLCGIITFIYNRDSIPQQSYYRADYHCNQVYLSQFVLEYYNIVFCIYIAEARG